MDRRDCFQNTLHHKRPEKILVDFGGNPLSSMEGDSENKLLEFLGYPKLPEDRLPFGKVKRIDERILNTFSIDTRSVGEILHPEDSQYRVISEEEYIDEWGIRRRFTGLYWDIVESPLKGASTEDLKHYRWPNADSISADRLSDFAAQAKALHENTDYVICAEHPVYGHIRVGLLALRIRRFSAENGA